MTKKILLGIALVASVASCTDDYKDWVAPQTSTPVQAVVFGDGSVTPVGVIDFANIPVDQQLVKVCNIVAPTVSDQAYTPTFLITLGDKSYNVDIDGNMKVSDLKNYVKDKYGLAPTEREISSTIAMWLSNGTTTVKTATSGEFLVKAKLVAPKISENYYIVGGTLDWATSAQTKEQKFSHSSTNVYDDPVFTITFPASADGDTWFAIGDDEALDAIANNNDWSKLLGTTSGNGNNGTSGFLKTRAELPDDGSFCVANGAKYIRVTINMMEYSYTVETVAFEEYIYVPGNGQGWNPGTAAALYSDSNDGVYTGYAYLDGDFKFTKHRDWNAEYNWNDFSTVPAGWTQGDGTNIKCPEAGVYYLTVNVSANSIQAVKVEKMGIIGDFNGWGGDVEMTWNAADNCYEAVGAGVTANGWKFRINSDWGINLGSNDSVEPSTVINDLVANGKNIGVVGNTIKLYPLRNASEKIYCTVE